MSNVASVIDQAIAFWFSWMVSMTWQVAVLATALAVTGFLLRSRSARFRYCMWTLVPIRLLLPPSLALMTGWAWWLLPCQTSSVDNGSKVSGSIVVSKPDEAQRSRESPIRIVEQDSAYVSPRRANRKILARTASIVAENIVTQCLPPEKWAALHPE